MLDEECLRPGVVSDTTFLAKLNQLFSKHDHYESKVTQNAQRQYDHSMGLSCFRICHYAGKVRERAAGLRGGLGSAQAEGNRGRYKSRRLPKETGRARCWDKAVGFPGAASKAGGPPNQQLLLYR